MNSVVEIEEVREAKQKDELKQKFTFENRNNNLYIVERDGSTEEITHVCYPYPSITKDMYDIETGKRYFEVAWKNGYMDTFSTIVAAHQLATKSKLVGLSDYGLGSNDNNAKTLIEFFKYYLASNYKEIPKLKIAHKIGHSKVGIIHPLSDDRELVLKDESGGIEAFQSSGTTEEWIENVLNPVKHSPIVVAAVAASFASLLVKPLKLDPFIVDISGTTSLGKSFLLQICASIYGERSYYQTWNSTAVGIEMRSNFLNSFPLMLDDTKNVKNVKVIEEVVYNFSEGKGRLRGAKTGGTQEVLTWNNILISTGESSLASYCSGAGTGARILQLNGAPLGTTDGFEIKELTDKVGYAMEEYHGAVGLEFVKELNDTLQKEDEMKVFRETLRSYRKYFADFSNHTVYVRTANYYALLRLTIDMLNTFFGKQGMYLDPTLLDEVAKSNAISEDLDINKRKLLDILEEVQATPKKQFRPTRGEEERNPELPPMIPDEFCAVIMPDGFYLSLQYVNNHLGADKKNTRADWERKGLTKELKNPIRIKSINRVVRAIRVDDEFIKENRFDFS